MIPAHFAHFCANYQLTSACTHIHHTAYKQLFSFSFLHIYIGIEKMSIQFAAIVHEQDVLAKHPEHTHHPYELIISNLERLNRKVTLTHGEYHYHVVCEGAYLFLCVAHKDFSMKMCYALLGELKDITLRGEKNLKAELKNRMVSPSTWNELIFTPCK
eukprot:GEZU01018289.1.p1 GENE.GEZU01018289.1~~GEZU01018289.1.p1  ORF type:complete len:158 (-),score=17.90 GEZU01018289.1:200-673(-)